jgi:hypothetical protein
MIPLLEALHYNTTLKCINLFSFPRVNYNDDIDNNGIPSIIHEKIIELFEWNDTIEDIPDINYYDILLQNKNKTRQAPMKVQHQKHTILKWLLYSWNDSYSCRTCTKNIESSCYENLQQQQQRKRTYTDTIVCTTEYV